MGTLKGTFFGVKKMKVRIVTMDADLDGITLDARARAQELFDIVCRIIGLREAWFFGLNFVNADGVVCWLKPEQKILKQGVQERPDGSYQFFFLVKFYPESVDDELIQDITRHLFFLQTKQNIITMELYCQPEAAVLLASYAVQVAFGDCSDEMELDIRKLLPKAVIDQYDMTPEMWIERIRKWWANNNGLSTGEAETEYLRIAQDLYMFGIQYYPITNQNETDLLLGASPHGIGIYKLNNRLAPQTFFHWKEIKGVALKNGQFTVTTLDKSKLKFRAQRDALVSSIMDVCTGLQLLYHRRQLPDNLEVQQLKVQAGEQRKQRMEENNRLQKEREQRLLAETERDGLRAEATMLREQLVAMQEMIRSYEEANKLITEKARISEKEALGLSKRASKAEAEVQRIKLSELKAEENKIALERKVRDAELIAHRLMHQDQQPHLAQQHQQQLHFAHGEGGGGIKGYAGSRGCCGVGAPPQNGGGAAGEGGVVGGGGVGFGGLLPPPPPSYTEFAAAASDGFSTAAPAESPQQQALAAGNINSSGKPVVWRHNKAEAPPPPITKNSSGRGAVPVVRSSQSTSNLYQIHQHQGQGQQQGQHGGGEGHHQVQPGLGQLLAGARGGGLRAQQKNVGGSHSQTDLIHISSSTSPTCGGGEGRQSAINQEIQHLSSEIEQAKTRYNEKNANLKEQLNAFRAQLESLRREKMLSLNDQIFDVKFHLGFDRQSTLRKSGAGPTSKRAEIFDGL